MHFGLQGITSHVRRKTPTDCATKFQPLIGDKILKLKFTWDALLAIIIKYSFPIKEWTGKGSMNKMALWIMYVQMIERSLLVMAGVTDYLKVSLVTG